MKKKIRILVRESSDLERANVLNKKIKQNLLKFFKDIN